MARLPRLALPGLPHQLIQRGNNSQTIFTDAADRQRMLSALAESLPRFGVQLHAYVLLDNQFRLLATPSDAAGLPALMQALGRSYVRYFNARHGRSGTLWEGRYRSAVIQAERYLLSCMACIDLSPVRAALVAEPSDFAWSSHTHCVGLRQDRLITPHALYWALGNTPFAREAAYAEWVRSGVDPVACTALADGTLRGWAVGDADFLAQLAQTTERRVQPAQAGRPAAAARFKQ